jgi:hypothetical protein
MLPEPSSAPATGTTVEVAGEPVEDIGPGPDPFTCAAGLPRRTPGLTDVQVFTPRHPGAPDDVPNRRRRASRGWARRWSWLPALLLGGGLLAGCGGSTPPAQAGSGSGPLATVCPATIVVQTSWFPESTHGGLFQLLGPGYAVDAKRKRVQGRLYDRGKDTGLGLEIRAGGPALGGQPVSALMAVDHNITFGQQATEEQVLGAGSGQPTVAVIAPF